MGFFNKKEEKSNNAPAMPAPPSLGSGVQVKNDDLSHLNDIKSQVTDGNSSSGVNNLVPKPSIPSNENVQSSSSMSSSNVPIDDSEDSLFDLSDLETPNTNQASLSSENSGLEKSSEIPQVLNNSRESSQNTNYNNNIESQSNNLESTGFHNDISFEKNEDLENFKKQSNIFVTTAQFKTLLSIIDSVKLKVKYANETHLRLMDIKAEEDVEYENLKKTFQFIEDKLYEVDNLIFD